MPMHKIEGDCAATDRYRSGSVKRPTPSNDGKSRKRPAGAAGAGERGPIALEGIAEPGAHDVLLGRGGGINSREGNVRFRDIVKEHKLDYMRAKKVDKPKVAVAVVRLWRKLDPPGRFLEQTSGTSLYHDVGDKKAQLKASQCLRERTPEVISYVRENEKKKLGVPDILVALQGVPTHAMDSTVPIWVAGDLQTYLDYRSLVTTKNFRLVPIYYLGNYPSRPLRRCIQRQGNDIELPNNGSSEFLAVVRELKSQRSEKSGEARPEAGNSFFPVGNESRYAWVRAIPNGRLELSWLLPVERRMLRKIVPLIISSDPTVGLPGTHVDWFERKN